MEIKTKLTVLGCYLKLKLGYKAKEAARWLLQFYQQQDDLEAVLDFYEEAFALNPEDETLLLECADFLYQRQQNSQAISLYKQIIAINPSIFLAHRNLGNLFIKQLRWQEAEQAYRKGIQLLNTPSVFIYRKLAKTLAQQQRWLDALSVYEKAWDDPHQIHQVLQGCNAEIQQGFETWETYLLLFQTLAEAKQWTGAIAAWWQAITLDPYQGWWRYERCLSLSKTYHKLDELESLFRQEFKKNPGELDLGLNLSAILEQQGRLEEVYTLHQEIANYKLKQRCPDLSPQIPLKSPQVNLTIIGAQKSGTSSLYYYLEKHPNISVSIKKELHFWSLHYEKGQTWYRSHFLPIPEGQVWRTGEASPTYLDSPETPERMYHEYPDMKLIVLLRNPISRAISHYYHWVRLKKESRPLDIALTEQLAEIPDWDDVISIRNHYIARGCYVKFLEKWLRFFPREQMLVIPSERFQDHPSDIVQTVHSFLKIPPKPLENLEYYNVGEYHVENPSLKSQLQDFYAPYTQDLETLLGQSFPWTTP